MKFKKIIIANTISYEFYENPRMILDRIILAMKFPESVWELERMKKL